MKRKLLAALIASTLIASPAMAMLAFLVGEYVTGMTKQCIYESPYGRHTVTIKSYELCPLTIEV